MTDAVARIAGQVLLAGRYRLVRPIDLEGTAQLWEGRDEILSRDVAIKAIDTRMGLDHDYLERFAREAVAGARLSHTHLVATYDTGIDDGIAFLVTELIKGRSLTEVLAEDGPLSPAQAVSIGVQVADVLRHAHRAGVVHGDLTADRILVVDGNRVKVSGFFAQEATPPSGGDGDRADVYCLGSVLYQMLCGVTPPTAGPSVPASPAGTTVPGLDLWAQPVSPRRVRAGIPRPLDAVVRKALDPDPDRRFANAAELRSALMAIDLEGDDATAMVVRQITPPHGTPSTQAQPSARGGRRRGLATAPAPKRSWRGPAVLLGVVLAVLVLVGVLFANSRHPLPSVNPVGGRPSGPGLSIAGVAAFDPMGDGHEHDDELPRVHDADPSTSWSTQRYGNIQFGGLKSGVGLVLRLEGAHRLTSLQVHTPTAGWQAEVFTTTSSPSTLAGWGQPLDTGGPNAGQAGFNLRGARATAVLLWFTRLSPQSDGASVSVSEVTLLG